MHSHSLPGRFTPLHELDTRFLASEYRIKWAETAWEREGAHALRRAVFCAEQQVFAASDEDEVDRHAQLIVALSCLAGVADEVVGTVRIHEAGRGTGVWWGSRLAVEAGHRSRGRIGTHLIRLAVSSARARGCREFLAHIQSQNLALFQRLHWHTLGEVMLHGRAHHLVRADLDHYPACHDPCAGRVVALADP